MATPPAGERRGVPLDDRGGSPAPAQPTSTSRRPPNLSDDPARLLDFGIDDFGGVSPVTADHVNPERAWPAIATLAAQCAERGLHLVPRLTVYPEFVDERRGFLDEKVRPFVLAHADSLNPRARRRTGTPAAATRLRRRRLARRHERASRALLARYEPGYDFDDARARRPLQRARRRLPRRRGPRRRGAP